MIKIHKNGHAGSLLAALLLLTSSWPAGAQQHHPGANSIEPETEAQLIQDLAPANSEGTITHALSQLEDRFPTSTSAPASMKALLSDSREPVRRKAAMVLGVFHAKLSPDDLQQICKMLKANDWREVQSGLKALRGLNAPEAMPDILACLRHPNHFVVRDACRTLAVLGNQSTIAAIEPLLNDPDPAVKKDAQDAIFKLRLKSTAQ